MSVQRMCLCAACCLTLSTIPAATRSESVSRGMSVGAYVVESCRATVAATAGRRNALRARGEAPPSGQVEVRCAQAATPYSITREWTLSPYDRRERRPRDSTHVTIVF